MNKNEFDSPLAKSVIEFAQNVVDNYENKKWIRLENGEFHEIKSIDKVFDRITLDNYDRISLKEAKQKCTFGLSPQELIQVGDLVCIEKLPPQCIMEMKNNRIYVLDVAWGWSFENVTAIYTPNKDKTQYTLQWKREEDLK